MISSAYTYYLTTYGGQQVSKYDTHKRSELRSVYNNMLRVNRKSPLYKITDADNTQKYAIDLKESARAFKNVAASLTDTDGSISGFLRKKAVSSNTEILDVKYIGDEDSEDEAEQLEIEISRLASTQINEGNYLEPSESNLKKGTYAFDVNIGEYTYEFSFSVKENDTNGDVQDKLVRLFNRANIGVKAEAVTDELGGRSIRLESTNTGISDDKKALFTITANDKSDGNVIKALGLDNIKQEPSNALFSVNGVEHTASSNTFSVSHQYELTLKNVSLAGEAVQVGVKQDVDSVLENVEELLNTYNSMVDLAIEKSGNVGDDSEKLIKDINNMVGYYKDSLESAGFRVLDDGHIETEVPVLVQAAKNGSLDESLEKLNQFKKAVVNKADDISVNPMKYVNKKLIAYPNPVRNFTSPYVSSIYSGMMFNGYI